MHRPSLNDSAAFVRSSPLYQEFLAEREEILRHKWHLSEQAGQDVGFERALLDWCRHHRTPWRHARRHRYPFARLAPPGPDSPR